MTLSFIPATGDEKEFCRQLHHAAYRDVIVRQFGAWNEPLQDSFFENTFKSSGEIILWNGDAVGFLAKGIFPDHVFLSELQLLPEYQGRGVGTRIIRQIQEEAAQLKRPIRLQVLRENKARELYERLGFTTSGETGTHVLMEWK